MGDEENRTSPPPSAHTHKHPAPPLGCKPTYYNEEHESEQNQARHGAYLDRRGELVHDMIDLSAHSLIVHRMKADVEAHA